MTTAVEFKKVDIIFGDRSREALAMAHAGAHRSDILAKTGAVLAIHLSIHTLESVVETLVPHYGRDCPAAIVYRASWPDEMTIRGTLQTIAAQFSEQAVERTALILVGRSLGGGTFKNSALYDADYQRRFRTPGWRGSDA